jgi:thiamine-phosphate pyrophosphorylase
MSPEALRLYLIFDPGICRSLSVDETVSAVIANGITALQLRWKSGTDREIVELARQLGPRLREAGVPFLINDRIDLALAAGADGVHLGVDDLPLPDARQLGGSEMIIGYSPETDDQILAAADYASYLGVGPLFETRTKLDAGEPLGTGEFARRRSLTSLPVVAIGGITPLNATEATAIGADGVAVASAILGVSDPGAATRDFRTALSAVAT